ncbi:glucosyltransferase [Neurospora sp. IMI 360204]|nr:glucosyltransferase [Neurospora sp. IMI 360204]
MFATRALRSSYPAYKSPYGPKLPFRELIWVGGDWELWGLWDGSFEGAFRGGTVSSKFKQYRRARSKDKGSVQQFCYAEGEGHPFVFEGAVMFLRGCGMDQNRDQRLTNFYSLPTTAAWGGVALFAVIYYASGIPRVQRDLLQHIPYIGKKYFVKEIPASDNPF